MSSIMGSRRWKATGMFDLETGCWQGEDFPIDADVVEAVTTVVAMNEVPGAISREVNSGTGDARLIIVFGEPVAA